MGKVCSRALNSIPVDEVVMGANLTVKTYEEVTSNIAISNNLERHLSLFIIKPR